MGRVMDDGTPTEFDWLEWKYAGPNDLHDSGYRYLMVVGVLDDKKYALHTSADHITIYGSVNMDVTAEGIVRIMSWGGKLRLSHRFLGSDATFMTTTPGAAVSLITTMAVIEAKGGS